MTLLSTLLLQGEEVLFELDLIALGQSWNFSLASYVFWTRFSILVRDDGFLYLVILFYCMNWDYLKHGYFVLNVDCLEGT